jgi:hypothetical protein
LRRSGARTSFDSEKRSSGTGKPPQAIAPGSDFADVTGELTERVFIEASRTCSGGFLPVCPAKALVEMPPLLEWRYARR